MWPSHFTAAAAFTFDFDAEELWIGEDPANADKPGVLSQGTYGAKVGVPEILKVLERRGVRGTFFIPGRVAEQHSDRVREIIAAGHEVGHHGYTHRSPTALDAQEERQELEQGMAALTALGATVSGYRSPSWDFSDRTLDLLGEYGFEYSSNLMDDLKPYRHSGTAIAEVPVQWLLDDAPHFWFDAVSWNKKISTTSEVREIWEAELQGMRGLNGSAVFTMHPQIIGRPSRLQMLSEFIEFVQGLGDVWIATCAEIAACAASGVNDE